LEVFFRDLPATMLVIGHRGWPARYPDNTLAVLVWTVNDPGAAIILAEDGVAGVFTDDPGMIRQAIGGT
jgi:glycerophosphoryl diester phosphodiesterase